MQSKSMSTVPSVHRPKKISFGKLASMSVNQSWYLCMYFHITVFVYSATRPKEHSGNRLHAIVAVYAAILQILRTMPPSLTMHHLPCIEAVQKTYTPQMAPLQRHFGL